MACSPDVEKEERKDSVRARRSHHGVGEDGLAPCKAPIERPGVYAKDRDCIVWEIEKCGPHPQDGTLARPRTNSKDADGALSAPNDFHEFFEIGSSSTALGADHVASKIRAVP